MKVTLIDNTDTPVATGELTGRKNLPHVIRHMHLLWTLHTLGTSDQANVYREADVADLENAEVVKPAEQPASAA
jgi:hypothetical protein